MYPRFYHDHEFLEDGRTIDTISVGIVAPDGAEYYAVVADAPWHRVSKHEWLMENVMPFIPTREDVTFLPDLDHPDVKLSTDIANELVDFFAEHANPKYDVELAGWYSAYDHVSLMRFWGPMMARPQLLPMYTHDLKQAATRLERLTGEKIERPAQGDEHHALADARWNKAMDEAIYAFAAERRIYP